MKRLPVAKTIINTINTIKSNYKSISLYLLLMVLAQYFNLLIKYINPVYVFAGCGAFLFYFAFIAPLFKIKESESPTAFLKKYCVYGMLYASIVLMSLVMYDIFNNMLFYYMFLCAVIYLIYFFLGRKILEKDTLFDKSIFVASIRKIVAITLIIFAGFMLVHLGYRFLSFLLDFAAIPDIIQKHIITKENFVKYSKITTILLAYASIYIIYIVSSFAWVAEIDEKDSSISLSFILVGKNVYRLIAIMLGIFACVFLLKHALQYMPMNFSIINYIINAITVTFLFVLYIELYKFLYKEKR